MDKPKKFKIPKGLRLKALGYQWMLILCMALLVVSGWEIFVRIDAMHGPMTMFFDMARGEGIPITRALRYFEWNILEALIWLVCCMLTAVTAIFVCRRPLGSAVMTPFCAAAAIYGLMRESSLLPGLWYLAQPALLLAMTAFCALNVSTCRAREKNLIKNLRLAAEQAELQEEASGAPAERTASKAAKGKKNLSPDAQERGECPDEADMPEEEAGAQVRHPLRKASRSTRGEEERSAGIDAPRLGDAPRLRRLGGGPAVHISQTDDESA